MSIEPGTRFGSYEVLAKLGEGGMGAVYRARDTKLNRDVALKVLLPEVANDAERLARFRREAQMLASLNHPHIGAIHGLEESPSTGSGQAVVTALVMELVEGEDLSQRLARGAIPIGEALPIAKQIAEALEAAHEQGIVHRDLKPANIKVRDDGTVKVLDFGLAKAIEKGSGIRAQGSGAAEVTNGPTLTSPAMTGIGMILGTAAYMAPEQARGRAVDKRADIWAFGCVLFEMLTGARSFGGEDVADVLSRVLQREPDLAALPPATPAHVRTLIARCLVKDPRQRLRDIGEARLALDGSIETPAPQAQAPAPAAAGRRAWIAALAAAALVIVALAVPVVRHLRETTPSIAPEIRADIVTPQTRDPASFALSPDGQQLVFVASGDDGRSRLWLRSLSGTTARPLAGTEEATLPFWSPDSRSIGFFAVGSLKRIDVDSEAPRVLARALSGAGGTWGREGTILFTPAVTSTVMRVAAGGGPASPATTFAAGQASHLAPWFLPDGRRFLFQARGGTEEGIYLSSIDAIGAATQVTPSDGWGGVYLSAQSGDRVSGHGWLLWTRGGALVAQQLDADRAALTGELLTVAARLGSGPTTRFQTSPSGLIAYRAETPVRGQLTWVDRGGVVLGTVGDAEVGLSSPRVSPDGKRVAVVRMVQGNADVWILDGTRSTRLTFDPGIDGGPVWSPDGGRIAFSSLRTGAFNIFQKLTSGAGPEERLLPSEGLNFVTSWSGDGRFLLYFSAEPKMGADLWVLPVAEGRSASPRVVLKTPSAEVFGAFSPDGRWIAFQVDQGSGSDVYVRSFRPPDQSGAAETSALEGQWQVSNGGGIRPRWRADGKELYFLNPSGMMMAAPIAVNGSALVPGAPVALFQSRIADGGVERQQPTNYDVAPDGRFLIIRNLEDTTTPITLLLNWRPPVP